MVLGTASREARANESQKLLNWGFTAFDPVRLFEAGKAIVTPEVWKGKQATAKLGAEGALVSDGRACTAVPALKVDPIDATGAGDCFDGSYLHRRCLGEPPLRASIA